MGAWASRPGRRLAQARDPDLMKGHLRHLLAVMPLASVSLGILPARCAEHRVATGGVLFLRRLRTTGSPRGRARDPGCLNCQGLARPNGAVPCGREGFAPKGGWTVGWTKPSPLPRPISGAVREALRRAGRWPSLTGTLFQRRAAPHPGQSDDQLVKVTEIGPISLIQTTADAWSQEKFTFRQKSDSQNGALRGLSQCSRYDAIPKPLPGRQSGTQPLQPL